MDPDRTYFTQTQAQTIPVPREKACRQPRSPDRDSLRSPDRHSLGISTTRNGMRQRHDLLAAPARLAGSWRLGQVASAVTSPSARSQQNRLVPRACRLRFGARCFWGAHTGPNPTDRRKKGSKHHVVTDANGIPLATQVTAANRHDVTQLVPLVDAIPPVAGKPGHPRSRPERVQGDRGYDSEPHRKELRKRRIQPILAKRNTEHGSGLGVFRWVVERTISWLHQYRRLRIRYERRPEIHEAFLTLGCALICFKCLNGSFC